MCGGGVSLYMNIYKPPCVCVCVFILLVCTPYNIYIWLNSKLKKTCIDSLCW